MSVGVGCGDVCVFSGRRGDVAVRRFGPRSRSEFVHASGSNAAALRANLSVRSAGDGVLHMSGFVNIFFTPVARCFEFWRVCARREFSARAVSMYCASLPLHRSVRRIGRFSGGRRGRFCGSTNYEGIVGIPTTHVLHFVGLPTTFLRREVLRV